MASPTRPTRERILDATLALVQERGFGGTTVTDIEELAGLSPGSGSFYRHFRSKEEAVREVYERELDRARRHRESFERGPVDDPPQALTRRLVQQLAYMEKIGPLITLLAREHGRFPDLEAKIGRSLLDQGIVEEADHLTRDLSGSPAHGDPRALLTVVISAITGYHLAKTFFGNSPGDVTPERFAATLADLIITAPADPPGSPAEPGNSGDDTP
ncbi:TetR/AcrR family transcriptional regulator [Spirillospora sp. NPDC048911]|uniref:TetR/AcrR family transcriptional regulator n=1 Tax=Spirillospora sp. NPDC048911 TaxID=3364527 RepID=UPI003721863D